MRMTTDILTRAEHELSAQVIIEIGAMLGRKRMRQADLARALGVGPMWVSDRMTGRTRLTIDDLDRIATALGVGIVDLLPRDRRQQVTGWYPSPAATAVSGTVPHPRHPIVAAAVPLPGTVRHGDARRERRGIGRKVGGVGTSADRITAMSIPVTA